MPGDVVFGIVIGFGSAGAVNGLLLAAFFYLERRRRPRAGGCAAPAAAVPAPAAATRTGPVSLLALPEWPVTTPGPTTRARRVQPPAPEQPGEGS